VASRLEWFLSLEDRLSGPAGRISRQLGEVRAQLRRLDIDAKTNSLSKLTDPLKRQRVELQLHRDRLMLSKAAMEKHGSAARWLGTQMKSGREALRDWLLILDPVARGLHFVADRATEMGKRIIHAVSFKQGSMIGLEAMFGAKGGADVFERMSAMSAAIGKPTEQLVEMARSLAMVGVQQEHLEPMVRLIQDLDALSNGTGGGGALANTIRSIYSAGKMTMGDVSALSPFLKQDELLKRVGGLYGAPNKFAGKAILESDIGVAPNLGVRTILDQVLAMEGGKAGSASAKMGNTPDALLDRIGTQLSRMYDRLSGSAGMKAFQGTLRNLTKLFDPGSATGRAMFERLNSLSDAIAKMLEPLTGTAGLKKLELFFAKFISLTKSAMPVVSWLGDKMMKLVDVGVFLAAGVEMRQGKQPNDPEALRSSMRNLFGPAPWETQGGAAAAAASRAPVTVNVNVDARGASREDAQYIAEVAKAAAVNAVTDAFDQAATARGAQ
jgi:hypothetical protein